MADKTLIDERIETMWARTRKWLEQGSFDQHIPEALDDFGEEILPPLAAKLFFKGVAKLDERSAETVLAEVGTACGGFELGLMTLKGVNVPLRDLDAELDHFLRVHELGENVASGGKAKLTRDGDSATLVIEGGCVCPLVKKLGIEPSANHCFCTLHHLKHVYETVLDRPVQVELLETFLRGGNSCTIRMSW